MCFHKQNPVITACGKKHMALQPHHHHKSLINSSIITKLGCCSVVSGWKTPPKPPALCYEGTDFRQDLKPVPMAEHAFIQSNPCACQCCSPSLANTGIRSLYASAHHALEEKRLRKLPEALLQKGWTYLVHLCINHRATSG